MSDLVARARAALDGVTPGPWDWEINRASKAVELCGGKGASDLTVMSFARYGMNSAAPVFWTWDGNYGKEVKRADELAVPAPGRDHHAKWFARIDHPDARFIAAARSLVPDMADRIEELEAENARLREAERTAWERGRDAAAHCVYLARIGEADGDFRCIISNIKALTPETSHD